MHHGDLDIEQLAESLDGADTKDDDDPGAADHDDCVRARRAKDSKHQGRRGARGRSARDARVSRVLLGPR